MLRDNPKILIIGGGPTGLGAALRLNELGHDNWKLVDCGSQPGGLASSIVDDHGFTWDLGGHVLFSHYEYFDQLMDELLPDGWLTHQRESWVWMRDRFIPYPLQQNVWRLPEDDLVKCLNGFLSVHGKQSAAQPRNFREWILQNYGEGLADVFMIPYNRKVWAYDPDMLATGWMGERVAQINLNRILENLVRRQDDCSWGPNAVFRFPLYGGTGAIWKSLYERLPRSNFEFGKRARSVSLKDRKVTFADGSREDYDFLVSTMPLDLLLRNLTDWSEVASIADDFRYSSSHIVGVGIKGTAPESLSTKSWLYFPEPEVPFYRVTVFSNYSPNNVPDPSCYWSLMAEVSESSDKPVNSNTVAQEVVDGLIASKLMPADAEVGSVWHKRLEHGYPTPFLGRDSILDTVDPELRSHGIWSRGRFGAWKYEVSNQDHSLMQGVEAVDHILFGSEETTYRYPNVVNSRKCVGRKAPILPARRSDAIPAIA